MPPMLFSIESEAALKISMLSRYLLSCRLV
jgi:hypothetical protein